MLKTYASGSQNCLPKTILFLCSTTLASFVILPASAQEDATTHHQMRQRPAPRTAMRGKGTNVASSPRVNARSQDRRTGATPIPQTEDIAVKTARRPFGFEKEQHVAASGVNLAPEELMKRNIQTVSDLGKVAPGLQIQSTNGGSGTSFRLRGVGLQDFTGNNTPMVMTWRVRKTFD